MCACLFVFNLVSAFGAFSFSFITAYSIVKLYIFLSIYISNYCIFLTDVCVCNKRPVHIMCFQALHC